MLNWYLQIMNWFIAHLNQVSAAFALITAFLIVFLGVITRNQSKIGLEEVLGQALTASSIPTGLVLIDSVFFPSHLQQLEGINVHLATAGIALLYISIKTIIIYFSATTGQSSSQPPSGSQTNP